MQHRSPDHGTEKRTRALTAKEVVTVLVAFLIFGFFINILSRRVIDRSHAANVARMQDHRHSICTAIEMYRVDCGAYPVPVEHLLSPAFLESEKAVARGLTRNTIIQQFRLGTPDEQGHYPVMRPGLWPSVLTTPMRYIHDFNFVDPFAPRGDRFYRYMVYRPKAGDSPTSFIVVGRGPDGEYDLPIYPHVSADGSSAAVLDLAAAPPNYGLPNPLDSYGDMYRIGGDAK